MLLVFGKVSCRANKHTQPVFMGFNVHTGVLGGPMISNSFFGGCICALAVTISGRSGFSFHRTCSSQCPKKQTWKKGERLFWILKKILSVFPALTMFSGRLEKLLKRSQMIQGPLKMPSEEKCKLLSRDFIQNRHVNTRKERKYWALKSSSILKR